MTEEERKPAESPGAAQEEAAPQDEVAEVANLTGELEQAKVRLAELEQALTGREAEVAGLKQSLSQAVASYKTLVLSSHPRVPAELISGDSIEAINSSLEKAKSLVSRVRQELEAEVVASRVPAGAPPRTAVELSALSPREKIQYGIGGKR
ncbi:MAG: hypothetical protein V1849_02475 [Chloroflexota bacterium]